MEAAEKLLHLRDKVHEHDALGKIIREERDKVQAEVMAQMTSMGFKSIKTDQATIAKSVRKSIQVLDQKKVIDYLKKQKLNEYYEEKTNDLFRLSYAPEMIKQEMKIPGTEVQSTEYISIRKPYVKTQ